MPFLGALRNSSEAGTKVADKIERDALLTKGIAWQTVADTNDKTKQRPNRCIRWEFPKEHKDYDIYYASYETCLEIAKVLALMAYRMRGAPSPDQTAAAELRGLDDHEYVCPICCEPIQLELFLKAKRSKAEIDTAHYPTPQRAGGRHQPDNIAFIHHSCNVAQGNRTGPEFIDWLKRILERNGYIVRRRDDQGVE
jgi:hypothetical protein